MTCGGDQTYFWEIGVEPGADWHHVWLPSQCRHILLVGSIRNVIGTIRPRLPPAQKPIHIRFSSRTVRTLAGVVWDEEGTSLRFNVSPVSSIGGSFECRHQWLVVVLILRRPPREVIDLVDDGLRGPRCYGVVEREK